MGCEWGRWSETLPSTPAPASPFPTRLPVRQQRAAPSSLQQKAPGDGISPQGTCPCRPASSPPGSPRERPPALEKPPRSQPSRASPVHGSCFPLSHSWEQIQAALPGEFIPQNCSGEGRAASLPLAALLPGSPSPLEAAQRRSLPAICCQRLGIETKRKPGTQRPSFLPTPPIPLFPLSCRPSPSPTSLWGPCRGAGAGSPSRSSQPAGIRRECAAQDARLSLRSSGTRGLGTDHTHNLPGSRGSGVTGLLFPRGWKCVRGIKARGLKEGLNIFVLKLSEPRDRAHSTHTRTS